MGETAWRELKARTDKQTNKQTNTINETTSVWHPLVEVGGSSHINELVNAIEPLGQPRGITSEAPVRSSDCVIVREVPEGPPRGPVFFVYQDTPTILFRIVEIGNGDNVSDIEV